MWSDWENGTFALPSGTDFCRGVVEGLMARAAGRPPEALPDGWQLHGPFPAAVIPAPADDPEVTDDPEAETAPVCTAPCDTA